jgi:putative ABC transport system permease protein
VYGVVAHTVSHRTAEFGIRMALGARGGAIAAMVVRQGLMLAASGTAIGLFASLFLTKLFSSLLFDVQPIDPGALAASAAIVAAMTIVASYIPARRAGRVDPMVALRNE